MLYFNLICGKHVVKPEALFPVRRSGQLQKTVRKRSNFQCRYLRRSSRPRQKQASDMASIIGESLYAMTIRATSHKLTGGLVDASLQTRARVCVCIMSSRRRQCTVILHGMSTFVVVVAALNGRKLWRNISSPLHKQNLRCPLEVDRPGTRTPAAVILENSDQFPARCISRGLHAGIYARPRLTC